MKLIIAQGKPVVPSRALDRITAEADLFIQVNMGLHYVAGAESTVVVQRRGQTEHTANVPVRRIPSRGILRKLLLPWAHLAHIRLVRRTLEAWPESRDAVFIARNWLCCLAGLDARKRGLSRKVVFWVGDFFPRAAKLETRVYHLLKDYALKHADGVWYANRRLMDAYTAADGKTRLARGEEKIVPILYDAHPEVQALWQPSALGRLVYVGYVQESQGVLLALQAMAALKSEMPGLTLDVVGKGPDLEKAVAEAGRLGLSDRVVFHGFVADEAAVRNIAAGCAAGLALYDPERAGHARYTITSKVMMYVGCGLPVIITPSAGSCDYVMEGGAGVKVEYTVESVAAGIREMCGGLDRHTRLRGAARKLSEGFDADAALLKSAIEREMEA